jgi:hypothetical protein
MKSLQEQFIKLENYSSLMNPPCSDSQIIKLEKSLNCELHKEIFALYKSHNGMKHSDIFPFRLMEISEILELHEFADWQSELKRPLDGSDELHIFWTDDNSNYAGLYTSGKLKDKICFIDHDEIDLSPLFDSMYSFYESLLRIAEENSIKIKSESYEDLTDWDEMKTDFPILDTSSENIKNFELAKYFIKKYASENDKYKKRHFAFCAMNLLPMSETVRIIDFVNSDDMWIQERACELIGKKHYEKGIPILVEIAKNGMNNGKVASLSALRNFKTEETEKEIEKLFAKIEDGYKIYLKPNWRAEK